MGMGAIGLVGAVASTGVQLYAQNQQAKAAQAAAKYNATLAEREAVNVERETAEGIKRQRMNNRAGLADLQNRMAGSGFQSSTGTPLRMTGEAAGRLEVGIADAARSASMQAASLRAKGKMGLWEADQFTSSNRLSMIAGGIGGLASAFGKYQEGKFNGVNYRIGGS